METEKLKCIANLPKMKEETQKQHQASQMHMLFQMTIHSPRGVEKEQEKGCIKHVIVHVVIVSRKHKQ